MHASVCDYLADVVQNAVEAGATRIELVMTTGSEKLEVRVSDNGKGMDAAQLARAGDPFYSEPGKHSRRRVGLGLPLVHQAAAATGGEVEMTSQPGHGTAIRFSFDPRHVDMPPLGDLPTTLVGLMTFPGDYDLAIQRRTPAGDYGATRHELIEALGNLCEAGNIQLARQFIASQEASLKEST
jgi:hypothetical protein